MCSHCGNYIYIINIITAYSRLTINFGIIIRNFKLASVERKHNDTIYVIYVIYNYVIMSVIMMSFNYICSDHLIVSKSVPLTLSIEKQIFKIFCFRHNSASCLRIIFNNEFLFYKLEIFLSIIIIFPVRISTFILDEKCVVYFFLKRKKITVK